jgi:DNA-binding transcriptional MerR regulator
MPYTTPQVAEITGATIRQLDHWARMEWIDLGPAPGTGKSRSWNRRSMLTATMIVKLLTAGFTVERSVKIANAVMDSVMTHTSPVSLQVKIGKGIRVTISTHEALGLISAPSVRPDTEEKDIA